MSLHHHRLLMALSILTCASCSAEPWGAHDVARAEVDGLVRAHATAWETGDAELLERIIHDEARVAYPGRRLGKDDWTAELEQFARTHRDTRIYVNRVVVEGKSFAVEWQFATTDGETGVRTAVSDAIIGRVKDGAIVLWKEYLDGRVSELQREGQLPLEEGDEPFPWPTAG